MKPGYAGCEQTPGGDWSTSAHDLSLGAFVYRVPHLGRDNSQKSKMSSPRLLRCTVALLVLTLLLKPLTSAQSSSPSRSTPTTTSSPKPKPNCANNGTYVNSQGQTVMRPETCSSAPQGATAQCRDGTYSFSKHRSGTCSHHGGVAKWL
jgi:hypothetical protein